MSDTSDQSPDFQVGELLEWRKRATPDSELVRKPVTFHGYKNNSAIISFGLKFDGTGEAEKLVVSPSELIRPVPQPFYTPEPRPAPPPISLSERRETLRQCYESFDQAQQVVVEAEELVNKAELRVQKAQHVLREYADLEHHAAAAVLHEIKMGPGNGHSLQDDDQEWLLRERALRDVRAAESALGQLTSDLADARTLANETEQKLHRAASFVLAAICDREALKLAMLEMQTAELRTQLRAVSYLWFGGETLQLDPAVSTILSQPPAEVNEGVGERLKNSELRQLPFLELFQKLVSGETEADLVVI